MNIALKIALALISNLAALITVVFSSLGLLLRLAGICFEDIPYTSFGAAIGVSTLVLVGSWWAFKNYHRIEDI